MNNPVPDNPVEFLKAVQRRDFAAFLQKAWPHISGGDLMAMNWHVDALVYQLNRVANGDSHRLLINLPPRNGKSKIVSVAWVAWMLGQDPSLNFIGVSYSNELSGKLARDCLSIMQSAWYRELFPGTIVSPKRSAAYDFETTKNGGRLATSISGTLTGRGGDIIILDDVIKPEDVHSETARNAVNRWYRSTLASRLNDKATGAIICVMQRLHHFDLPGMLLEAGGWDQLSLPAIATEDAEIPLTRGRVKIRKIGDILHPARESQADLDQMRATMGSAGFAAQYQQNPFPAQGNVFKTHWLRNWPDQFDPQGHGEIVQSWDTGIKTGEANAWSVCETVLIRDKQIYLLDVWRGRVEFPELRHKVIELARQHGAHTLLIEDKASGQQLIQTLLSESPQGVPQPIARTPTADKRSRAEGVSSMVEAGQLYLPTDAPWLGDFKSELLAFPNSRYDDQVDALAQLLEWARSKWTYEPISNPGPTLVTNDGSGGIHAIGENADDFNNPVYPEFSGDPWGA